MIRINLINVLFTFQLSRAPFFTFPILIKGLQTTKEIKTTAPPFDFIFEIYKVFLIC